MATSPNLKILATVPLILALLSLAACGRTERVADGPIRLEAIPKEVAFLRPVAATGPGRELCFEFGKPADSHAASDIRATLVTTTGRREDFRPDEVDRRGEALVCLLQGTGAAPEVRYRAVILSSETPARVRQIRWWSGGS